VNEYKSDPTLGELQAAFAALQHAGVSPADVYAFGIALDAVQEAPGYGLHEEEWLDQSEEGAEDDGDAAIRRAKEFVRLIKGEKAPGPRPVYSFEGDAIEALKKGGL
jgi:hypothetical protein